MSQNDLRGSASSSRTMIGLGLLEEARSSGAASAAEGSPEWFVKLFNWGGGLGAVVVREFTRQALGVARLRHPHIVQVVDAGSAPDGTPFVVMERLSGGTLEERAGGTLIPLLELLPILRGLASGLAAAHAAGVTHLELRADNVFMAEVAGYSYGFPKLLDFGVSALTAAACARGHKVEALASNAVPPEQRLDLWRGDARSDQYALAALAYRFLAVADLTPAIELVLARALAWHPDRRFDSMASFLSALEGAVRTSPQAPPPPDPAPGERPAPPGLEAGSLTQQFFAEGDRLEGTSEDDAGASGSRAAPASVADITLSVPERVPRNRAQMVAALSLALVSLIIVAWTAVSLSSAPLSWEPPDTERTQSPPADALARSAPAPTRTASIALRMLHPAKVARPSHQPTQPPPMTAPTTPPPPTPSAEPAAPTAEPTAPPIDEDATQPSQQTGGGPVDETQTTPAAP